MTPRSDSMMISMLIFSSFTRVSHVSITPRSASILFFLRPLILLFFSFFLYDITPRSARTLSFSPRNNRARRYTTQEKREAKRDKRRKKISILTEFGVIENRPTRGTTEIGASIQRTRRVRRCRKQGNAKKEENRRKMTACAPRSAL